MKKLMKHFFTGPGIANPLIKKEFFSAILYGTLLMSIEFFLQSFVLSKHLYFKITSGSMIVLLLLLLYMNKNNDSTKSHSFTYVIYCFTIGCVYVPLLYIYGGGIHSGIPLFFMVGAISTILLLDNWLMVLMLILNMGSAYFVYMFDQEEYIADDFSTMGDYTYISIASGVLFVGWAIGLFLRLLTKGFDEKEAKVKELYTRIEDAATKDPLSGAYNRRYLMDFLNKCIKDVEDGKYSTFSIIMFDIDHFKKINDTYGHLAGDDCIRNLSLIIQNTVRKTDVTTRYGGEEFICVLPTAEETPAFRRAEQIRSVVENTRLSENIDKAITVSGGVVMYKSGMTPDELIELADKNLYIAKENGRNQIVWHEGGIPPLVYNAYGGDTLRPAYNSGRRFSDATKF